MSYINNGDDAVDKVKIEIPTSMVASLMSSGNLTLGECRCLDSQSKQRIWQLLLEKAGA